MIINTDAWDLVKNICADYMTDKIKKVAAKNGAEQKAKQGITSQNEYMKEALDSLIKECGAMEQGRLKLTEDGIKSFYDEACEKSGFAELKSDRECYKRFGIFVREYIKYFIGTLSDADKFLMLLDEGEKHNKNIKDVGKAVNELQRNIKKDTQEIIENQHKVLDRLEENNIQIVIPEGQLVHIEPFSSKYFFYNNCFDFVEERNYAFHDYYENEYVISFAMLNSGTSRITDVSVSNLNINYCYSSEEIEQYFYIAPVAEYKNEPRKKNLNIMPQDRKNIFITFVNSELENNDEDETGTEAVEPEERNRLEISFDMEMKSDDKSVPFSVDMYISRNNDTEDIDGVWKLDMIVYSEAKR